MAAVALIILNYIDLLTKCVNIWILLLKIIGRPLRESEVPKCNSRLWITLEESHKFWSDLLQRCMQTEEEIQITGSLCQELAYSLVQTLSRGSVRNKQLLLVLLQEMNVKNLPKFMVYCDNLSKVMLSRNPVLHAKTKHMEIGILSERDKVVKGDLTVSHIPSQQQRADILTKPLSLLQFNSFHDKLNVCNFSSAITPTWV